MRYLIPMLCALAAGPALAQEGAAPTAAPAQTPPAAGPWDPATRLAAQREAMEALAFLDGQWRGRAVARPGGPMTQTERVGTLLDGTVRVVEGRGYDADGRTVFNALGIISYDPIGRTYSMHSYAMGYAGDFPLEVRPDGFSWSQPMGPGASVRYTATVRDGEWHETGDRITGDGAPARMLEMRLRRVGDAGWPAEGAVPPR